MPIRKIIVPDYYNEFKCKCGACRSSCCMGWRVTISYAEYCRLLGAQCKKDIRSKLDCALIPLSNATKERYAEIKHNYLGLCSMYRSDGLCSLHASCGEESLPAICRLYPRSLFMDGLDTGACANSCEAVVELLLNKQEPISFTEIQLYTTTEILPQTDNQELLLDLERKTILLLSDRSLPLDERLLTVGRLLSKYATVPTQTNNLTTPTDKQNNIEFLFSLATVMSEYSDAFRVLYSSLIKRAGIDEGNITKELSICKPQLLANF
ncbi:MAG: flagellin lysine-N-methylase, partial [Clostridia bacterium]